MFPCNQRHEWNFDCLWNIHQIVARLPGLYLFRQLIRTHTAPTTSISSSSTLLLFKIISPAGYVWCNSFFWLPFADLIWWIGARWRLAASATGWNPPLTLWNASTAWHDFSIPKVSSYHTHTHRPTDLLPGKKKSYGGKKETISWENLL